MLSRSISILNFDDSLTGQNNLLSRYAHEIVDLKNFSSSARYWTNAKTRGEIEKQLRGIALNCPAFLGSGDFHHISEILISRFQEPLSVISFDFHPDWDTLALRYGCGSWVNEVLRKEDIRKFILLGVSSKDISAPNIQSGNLAALINNRLEIYPYEHPPTVTLLKKIPSNVSVKTSGGRIFNTIYWSELKGKSPQDFLLPVLKRIPTKKVYVSIDKDCLTNDYALTNWEEGKMTLDELLIFLKLIKENLDIAGLDITGDYSPIKLNSPLKKILSSLDHPRRVLAQQESRKAIDSLNEETNLKILELLT